MRSTLIAPTFNEVEAVRRTLPAIDRSWVDEILVVDNHSTDGTIEWCAQHGYPVYLQQQPGYGNGIREAVQRATGEIIIEFPPDGSSLAATIPALIAKVREGYDLVIASRYRDGAHSEDDDALTAIGNWGFTRLTNLLFRTTYTDVLCGYRAYRKTSFDALGLDAAHLSWVIQSSIRFATHGYRVGEIGADEHKRIGGVRKMRPFTTGLELLGIMAQELVRKDSQR